MINYTLDYELAMGRKFHHQISKFVNNKQINKQGRSRHQRQRQSFRGYLRPTPIDGVLALQWQ